MQRVRFEHVFATWSGGDGQLFITVVQIFLRQTKAPQPLHFEADRRRRSIRADNCVGLNRTLGARIFVVKPRDRSACVESDTPFAEMNGDAARFRGIHQRHVQIGARNRVYDFSVILAVWLEREVAHERVHHASLHRHDDASHFFPQARFTEGVDSARGNGEIDRASRAGTHAAHVRTSLVNLHPKTSPRQGNPQQRAGESGANQRDGLRAVMHFRESAQRMEQNHDENNHPSRYVRASHNSGKNFLSRVSFR